MANKFAIDFDSSFTNIFKIGSGIVLSEPTVATIDDSAKGVVKAIGEEANKLIGKTTKTTKTVFSVFEGEIVNERVATEVLNGFLKKVGGTDKFVTGEILFSVPCGVEFQTIEKYRRMAKNCGIRKVYFVEAPILSALGQRIPLSDSKPFFVVDMAGGITNIATVSLDGVIVGVSVNFGANKISADIIDFISDRYGVQIGLQTAERLKNSICSLDESDELATVINGRNNKTGTPMSLFIKACELFEAVKIYYDKVVSIILSVLVKLSPEVSAEIRRSGIYVSGMASQMHGLKKYLEEKLDMQINLAEKGLYSVALGGGVVLSNQTLLKKLSLKEY